MMIEIGLAPWLPYSLRKGLISYPRTISASSLSRHLAAMILLSVPSIHCRNYHQTTSITTFYIVPWEPNFTIHTHKSFIHWIISQINFYILNLIIILLNNKICSLSIYVCVFGSIHISINPHELQSPPWPKVSSLYLVYHFVIRKLNMFLTKLNYLIKI